MTKHQQQTLPTGTRIVFFAGDKEEPARIARWTASCGLTKNHVSPTNGGWHIVEFEGGGKLCVHETGFRVVDNRVARAA